MAKPSQSSSSGDDLLDLGGLQQEDTSQFNITPVPFRTLLETPNDGSAKGGITINGAFRRQTASSYYFYYEIINNSAQDLRDFQMKFNSNLYGISLEEQLGNIVVEKGGNKVSSRLKCSILKSGINA